MDKYTTVSIPRSLFNKLEKFVKETGFTSVSSFVTYVLRELLATQSKESVEKVKDKLKKLGYL